MPADEYSPAKLSGVKAWQYTSTGSVDGVNGNVDLDVSFEDLTVGGAGTNYPAKIYSQISADAR